jgi:magnesium-transporting ATPase (P-type)
MEQPVPLTEKRNCVYNPEKANQIKINKVKEKVMTITKMYQIIMMFLLTYKRSLAQSANSQQPTANSQQPTANSQQVIFTVIILYFVIYILRTRAVSEIGVFSHFILWLLFFYAYLAVRLRLYSMFTKVNIPFVCVANSPLLTDRKVKGDPETSSG